MWRDLDRLVDDRLLNNDLEAHQLQLKYVFGILQHKRRKHFVDIKEKRKRSDHVKIESSAIDDNSRVLVLRENTFKDRRKDDDKFTSRNEWSLMSAKA
jgi:hypothetical protein